MTELLTISHVGHRGDGVAGERNAPVYVPYALPGERVEVEAVPGHDDRKHLLRVVEPSPDRIAPFCPHFGICGGCAIQHWSEPRYREWKRNLVVEALAQAGIAADVGELVYAHGEGRRRAVFHARTGTHDILEVGFSALRAHTIVPIDRCPVLAPSMAGAIEAAWSIAEILKGERKPLDIQVTATEGGLDIDVRGSGPLETPRMSALAAATEKHRVARLTRHGELVIQRAAPFVTIGRARVTLPPGSFLQATQAGEETLAKLVCTHAGKAKTVVDLFAGVGPFALRLAETARVTAAESEQGALEALAQAASAPGLKPVRTDRRDLFRRPYLARELSEFDAVVFDPPRAGAQAQAREIAASGVRNVIAVSCNAGTFARDAKILCDGGYRVETVTPVDQFRHAAHVEIVARFLRR